MRCGVGLDGEGTLNGSDPSVKAWGKAKLSHWPTDSSDFDKHRKIHYSEGKYLKTPKNLPLATEEDSTGAGASISSSNQGVAVDLKSRPVEKCWSGRLATGVRNDGVSVTNSYVLDTNG